MIRLYHPQSHDNILMQQYNFASQNPGFELPRRFLAAYVCELHIAVFRTLLSSLQEKYRRRQAAAEDDEPSTRYPPPSCHWITSSMDRLDSPAPNICQVICQQSVTVLMI